MRDILYIFILMFGQGQRFLEIGIRVNFSITLSLKLFQTPSMHNKCLSDLFIPYEHGLGIVRGGFLECERPRVIFMQIMRLFVPGSCV